MGENVGFVRAVNAGLRVVLDAMRDVKYVVIQNNDTEVTRGWLDTMRGAMERDSRLGAVGPVTTYGATQQAWTHISGLPDISEDDTEARRTHLDRFGAATRETPILTFFCTMFRSDVFKKLGLLDEDYGVGLWDDQDLCEKMRNAGWGLGVSMGAYVRHYHRTTFKAVYTTEQIESMKKKNQGIFARKSKERRAKN
jgi:GT2 family glycosyltransferase